VTLQLADGSTRVTFTNGSGVYKAWHVPAGAVLATGPAGATVTPSIPAPEPAYCTATTDCGGKVYINCLDHELEVLSRLVGR
jgi:hypothetical protein